MRGRFEHNEGDMKPQWLYSENKYNLQPSRNKVHCKLVTKKDVHTRLARKNIARNE